MQMPSSTATQPPPLMDVVFPAYQTALDNLPEEPTPLTLPALEGCFFQTEDMEDDSAQQHPEGAIDLETPGDHTQNPLEGAIPTVDPAAAQGPPVNSVVTPDGSAPEPVALQTLAAGLRRQEALEAFLRAPNLRDPTNLALGEVAILLHFLHDTPERGIVLSRLIPPHPPLEV